MKEPNNLKEVQGNIDSIKETNDLFSILVNISKDLIFILNQEGFFNFINENGARILDYHTSELLGKHFFDLVGEENKSQVSSAFQKILDDGNVIHFSSNLKAKFGDLVWFNISASPIKQNDKIEGVIAIAYDVTKADKEGKRIKDLTTKLLESNRIISIERDRAKQKISILEELNKLKNDFISNISHELRTPLASIVGFAETINTDEELSSDKVKEFNKIILDESKRLAKLIEDVLDLSKLEGEKETLDKENFDFVVLLKNLTNGFKELADKKNINYSVEIPEAEIIINADKERISKSFSNLISNAFKFTESGGRVTVIVQDFLREAEIIISDTGIGIPQDELQFIFEKFNKVETQTKKTKGSGLGLVTVKKIIDLHKGLIRVKSEVNKGTTFIIKLPKLI